MEIYERYGPALLRKAERFLGSREDARDVVQGLFLDMLERKQLSADLPYLYRAVTNRCLNHIRNRDTKTRLLAEKEKPACGVPRTRCDEAVIGLDLVRRIIARLDRKSGEILAYRYFDDMQQDEIAALLGASR